MKNRNILTSGERQFQLGATAASILSPSTSSKKWFARAFGVAVLLVFAIVIARLIPASTALTNGGVITAFETPFTENFDSLATAGTANTWTDNSTLPGWYVQFGATASPTTYRADSGGSNTGAIYSWGTGTSTERALGSVGSGTTGDIYWAVKLTNNTGSTITSLSVSYTGEQWRAGGCTPTPCTPVAQTVDFQYQVANSSVITDANTPSTGWLDHDPLDFTSPSPGTSTAAALDGNAAANRTALSSTINVTVGAGQEVWLRWKDINHPNNDHGLAIDDFSVTAHTTLAPTPPTGVGAANPNTVVAGGSTLLTVAVTPGTNPTSTGITVTGNLSSIGGSATQQFFDDGTHGDATAGDNTFSFQATVTSGTSAGVKSLPTTIADAQSRSGSASISLTVTVPMTSPSGTGAANPNTVMPGGSTLLTVNVTPGANPTSTGIAVTGDLSSIGGSGIQQFFDDGSHGDAAPGDNIFSFQATVSNATVPGGKTLPVSITDAQSRSGSTTIALTVQTQTVPPGTLVISQAYGGGGNSGSTYTNDFIEVYNRGTSTVNLAGWSVQYNSATATGAWQVTNLSGSIAPGHYFLVQESQGTGGTTPLPAPDATGTIMMSGTNAKVALVSTTLALSGCPTGSSIVDLVGYGSTANCSETSPTLTLSNTTAAIRRGNGCVDTDNNSADLFVSGPIPRNSASPVNSCGGDPNNPSGLGDSFPTSLDPATNVLLIVKVTPATIPPSTGISVSGDLTSIGGAASQQFFDDGTHGDATAGDNIFSFQATVAPFTTTGAKSILTTITDGQGRSATAPITLTVQSPTCGVERWSVKTGTDPDAALVDLNNPTPTTIAYLSSFAAPADPPGPPLNARVAPAETTLWVVNATMTLYKKEADVDYHIVIKDLSGNTMVTEIPCPCCVGAGSPFAAGVANARAEFDARLTATTFFQTVSLPVQITGVGFFDFIHGQTGVAPNGIELHPILDIKFLASTSTTLTSSANPSLGGQSITLTAAVTSTGNIAPTGFVTFKDGANVLGTGSLNAFGMATFTTSSLSIGSHTITAEYDGDANSGGSLGALMQTVNNNPPVARCKNVTVSADSSCMATGASTSVDDGSSDPDGDAITITQSPAAPYSLGDTTVTLTVTDNRGASTSCTAVVTVADTTPPSVTCPTGTTASADVNCQAAVPNVVVTASDNCTPAGSLTITQSPVAGTLVGLGVTTITVTVKDAANNAATCTTTFTVQDTTPPSISAQADASYQCASAVPAASASQATASDNCGTPTVTVTESNNGGAGSPASPLIITRVYTAADSAGHNASATQTITVIDNIPPVITTCATNKTLSGNANCQAAIPNLTGEIVATDNCSSVSITQSPAAGTLVSGSATVTITVKDAANNQSTCTATIAVVDATPPVVTCPAGTTASAGANCQAAVPSVVGSVTASDNCTSAGSLTITQNPVAGTLVGPGVTTITVTVKDAANNAATCTTTFTVVDTTPPTITCPANMIQNNDAGSCSAVVAFQPITSDNCAVVDSSCSPASGSIFPVGTTTVTCTAADAAHNHASCSFTVTVIDAQPPAITGASANPSTLWSADHKMADITITYSVTDNCTPTSAINCDLTVSSNEPPEGTGDGHTSPDWTVIDAHHVQLRAERSGSGDGRIYTITITCKDSTGNTTRKTVTVTVPHDQ
jgi:hypothetical protein